MGKTLKQGKKEIDFKLEKRKATENRKPKNETILKKGKDIMMEKLDITQICILCNEEIADGRIGEFFC